MLTLAQFGHGHRAQLRSETKSTDLKPSYQMMVELIPFYASKWQFSYRGCCTDLLIFCFITLQLTSSLLFLLMLCLN